MPAPIRFYFDLVSTYSYIAVHKIDELAARHGRTVDWIAVSLGHIFQSLEVKAPVHVPARLAYNTIDLARSCAFAGLPFRLPPVFPFDVRLARYVFWTLKAKDPKLARDFAFAVMTHAFGKGGDVTTLEGITAAAAHLGLTAEEIEVASADPAAKRAVVEAMDSARADGMIGAPFMVLDGEPFWGADRLDQLDRRLSESGVEV
ncbi:MAG: 2-hydroxychromene-2-carboxylate isomerase [Rhodospirillaceae bacterium]